MNVPKHKQVYEDRKKDLWKTISVTRFGDFWKSLATNFLSKVAQQKDCWLLGYFENDQLM